MPPPPPPTADRRPRRLMPMAFTIASASCVAKPSADTPNRRAFAFAAASAVSKAQSSTDWSWSSKAAEAEAALAALFAHALPTMSNPSGWMTRKRPMRPSPSDASCPACTRRWRGSGSGYHTARAAAAAARLKACGRVVVCKSRWATAEGPPMVAASASSSSPGAGGTRYTEL